MHSTTSGIQWISHRNYPDAIAESRRSGKPILLYLHSASCGGCMQLVQSVLDNPHAADLIGQHTVPVWVDVETDRTDPSVSALVGSHIFIMSPVLQLISADGDIFHKFLGAPLHTRLDLGYCRVHHDIPGDLTADEFMAQLWVGLGKRALASSNFTKAASLLRRALSDTPADSDNLASREANYWLPVAASRGRYAEDDQSMADVGLTEVVRQVRRFCEVLVRVPDDRLMADWPGTPGDGGWVHYTDCLREVALGAYQELLDVATAVRSDRQDHGRPQSRAQSMMADWQESYRELQGTLFGLELASYDAQHLHENYSLGKQRTIRNNIVHCVMAEFWAHAPAIRATLDTGESAASTDLLKLGPASLNWMRFGPPPFNFGPLRELFSTWEQRHAQLVEEFSGITDEQLNASRGWWEGSPVAVRFRLARLGWHLQDHAAVVETICERLGRVRTETERLAKRIFGALGRAEGAMIGMSSDEQSRYFANAATQFRERTDELERVYAALLKSGSASRASVAVPASEPMAA